MCGISGIYNFKTSEPVSLHLLEAMTDTLIHRGPDGEGFYASGPIGLGHRRLSIIDLQGGNQPMTNEDQSVWVVFNGEIYNFGELRNDLIKKGHTFKTRSDTEVIVHLYEEHGERCLQYLRGMFAIAIWDRPKRILLLARDRVGKKPLFYLNDGSRIVFASEIKAILKVPDIPRDIDLEAVSDYFSLLYIPAPKTIFKQIRKLRPGHYLVVSESGVREVEYWDISFTPTLSVTEEVWCERLLEAYREAVRIRLRSDVPLGAFLSGGIDSSSVVAVMSELMDRQVVTSFIGFDVREFNEQEYAREVASFFNTDHHETIIRPDAMGIIEKLAWHYDEPFADSSAIPTYYVSKGARQHVTVALSGDGGDEIFAGYRRYYFDKRENMVRAFLPSSLRQPIFGSLAAIYPKADWAPRVFRAQATFESLACSHIEGYFRSMSAFRPAFKDKLLQWDVKQELAGYDSVDVFRYHYDKAHTDDPVSRIQYVDMKTYLPDDILVKVDRASMANSLEVRSPLLDHKFMELVATIPSSLKVSGTKGKYIFKKALKNILPRVILKRKKMGFSIPLARWFRNDLKDVAYDLICNHRDDALLDRLTVRQTWEEHQRGFRDRSKELWGILMFRMWQREFKSGK